VRWNQRPTRLFGWCREGELNPKTRRSADFEGMKAIPFHYHQLLVSASDAALNKNDRVQLLLRDIQCALFPSQRRHKL
jgi:hypothetical protein